jgi:hypothetical protein
VCVAPLVQRDDRTSSLSVECGPQLCEDIRLSSSRAEEPSQQLHVPCVKMQHFALLHFFEQNTQNCKMMHWLSFRCQQFGAKFWSQAKQQRPEHNETQLWISVLETASTCRWISSVPSSTLISAFLLIFYSWMHCNRSFEKQRQRSPRQARSADQWTKKIR